MRSGPDFDLSSSPTLSTRWRLYKRSHGFNSPLIKRHLLSGGKECLGGITKARDAYIRSLLVLGARAVTANPGDKQDRFSRWVRNLIQQRRYWRAAVAIEPKMHGWPGQLLKYGDAFRHEAGEAHSA